MTAPNAASVRPVVGVDLSLTSTGVAVIDHHGVQLHRIESKGHKDATLNDRRRRLAAITADICDIIELAQPDPLAVIEAPSLGQARQAGTHDRSGLWWLTVNRLAIECGVQVVEVPPTCRAKYATGQGNAGKDAVLAGVVRRYPTVPVDGNDCADALVLAAMGARWLGHPIDDLPQTHLAAMDGVRWPGKAVA